MKCQKARLYPVLDPTRSFQVRNYQHPNPFEYTKPFANPKHGYPAHHMHDRNVEPINDAVRTVAGASVAVASIGVLGAMGIGFMGALRP